MPGDAVSGSAVYVIGVIRRVKVGVAAKPVERLAVLQAGSPVKLWLFWAVALPSRRDARALERWTHAALAKRAAWGEWFDVSPGEAMDSILAGVQALGVQGSQWSRPQERAKQWANTLRLVTHNPDKDGRLLRQDRELSRHIDQLDPGRRRRAE